MHTLHLRSIRWMFMPHGIRLSCMHSLHGRSISFMYIWHGRFLILYTGDLVVVYIPHGSSARACIFTSHGIAARNSSTLEVCWECEQCTRKANHTKPVTQHRSSHNGLSDITWDTDAASSSSGRPVTLPVCSSVILKLHAVTLHSSPPFPRHKRSFIVSVNGSVCIFFTEVFGAEGTASAAVEVRRDARIGSVVQTAGIKLRIVLSKWTLMCLGLSGGLRPNNKSGLCREVSPFPRILEPCHWQRKWKYMQEKLQICFSKYIWLT